MKFAIVDPNILAGIGLKQLIGTIMPVAEVEIFTSFEALESSQDEFIHYFTASRIYFEHVAFFQSKAHKFIVLVAGDMQISGCRTLNVCQSEQALAKSIVGLMQRGHSENSRAPHSIDRPKPQQVLSSREVEVAVLLAHSLINKEIADRLNISLTTVISHRKNIMDKIHARSLADITIYCIVNGLIDITEI